MGSISPALVVRVLMIAVAVAYLQGPLSVSLSSNMRLAAVGHRESGAPQGGRVSQATVNSPFESVSLPLLTFLSTESNTRGRSSSDQQEQVSVSVGDVSSQMG